MLQGVNSELNNYVAEAVMADRLRKAERFRRSRAGIRPRSGHVLEQRAGRVGKPGCEAPDRKGLEGRA